MAGVARSVKSGHVPDWQGMASYGGRGMEWRGKSRRGGSGQYLAGSAGSGLAGCGGSRFGMAGVVRRGVAGMGEAWHGTSWQARFLRGCERSSSKLLTSRKIG
jgi:hypothetical protein